MSSVDSIFEDASVMGYSLDLKEEAKSVSGIT
jgi:hypothetical protein